MFGVSPEFDGSLTTSALKAPPAAVGPLDMSSFSVEEASGVEPVTRARGYIFV